jgi:dihydrofolate reductase
MVSLQAIAAMSLNRAIGAGNRIPWHLPEDFRWFKRMTTGQVVVMGRKTFDSIGKLLPGRTTVVLSRSGLRIPGALVAGSLRQIPWDHPEILGRKVFICGGAQVYEQTLPFCTDLFLTLVQRNVDGDTFFPAFEDRFRLAETLLEMPEFKILHYQNQAPLPTPA